VWLDRLDTLGQNTISESTEIYHGLLMTNFSQVNCDDDENLVGHSNSL
jgi:hypothetical protein